MRLFGKNPEPDTHKPEEPVTQKPRIYLPSVGSYNHDSFQAFVTSPVETDFVAITLGELGFEKDTLYTDVIIRSRGVGLITCAPHAAEVIAPHVREPASLMLDEIYDNGGQCTLSITIQGGVVHRRWFYGPLFWLSKDLTYIFTKLRVPSS